MGQSLMPEAGAGRAEAAALRAKLVAEKADARGPAAAAREDAAARAMLACCEDRDATPEQLARCCDALEQASEGAPGWVDAVCMDEHEFFRFLPRTGAHLVAYAGGSSAAGKIALLARRGARLTGPLWRQDDFPEEGDDDYEDPWNERLKESSGHDKFVTPLYVAVERGNTDVIRALIRAGCSVDGERPLESGIASPLMWAARMVTPCRIASAEALLGNGADPNLVERHEARTVVHATSCPAVAKLLIAMGADVRRSSVNWTALQFTPTRALSDAALRSNRP